MFAFVLLFHAFNYLMLNKKNRGFFFFVFLQMSSSLQIKEIMFSDCPSARLFVCLNLNPVKQKSKTFHMLPSKKSDSLINIITWLILIGYFGCSEDSVSRDLNSSRESKEVAHANARLARPCNIY